MKKLSLVVALLAGLTQAVSAETRTATATASWDAKAIKDTKSTLVVTPLKSLTFNYSEDLERFNSQDGIFDIAIDGQSGASDFKLTSKLISNSLVRTSDNSVLKVGVKWNDEMLSNDIDTVMIDTSKNIQAGLDALAQQDVYAGTGRQATTSGKFLFNIDSATQDGAEVEFEALNDGYWEGNVNVGFVATWEGDFQ